MPRGVHPNSLANLKRGKRFGNGDDSTTIDASRSGKNGTKNKAGSSGTNTIYVPEGCKADYEEAWAELVKDGWTIQESNK